MSGEEVWPHLMTFIHVHAKISNTIWTFWRIWTSLYRKYYSFTTVAWWSYNHLLLHWTPRLRTVVDSYSDQKKSTCPTILTSTEVVLDVGQVENIISRMQLSYFVMSRTSGFFLLCYSYMYLVNVILCLIGFREKEWFKEICFKIVQVEMGFRVILHNLK